MEHFYILTIQYTDRDGKLNVVTHADTVQVPRSHQSPSGVYTKVLEKLGLAYSRGQFSVLFYQAEPNTYPR